jgi:hypothetical protein
MALVGRMLFGFMGMIMNFRVLTSATTVASIAAFGIASAAPVTVPAGTPVAISLTAPLSSGTATVGQSFAITTAEPVVVGTTVVVPKGAHGIGVVKKVNKAKGKGAGEITVAFTNVVAVDGTKVALSEVDHSHTGSAQTGKSSTATIAATIVLGPIGLFAHNMVKGKDVTLDPTAKLPSFVDANTTINVK